MIFFPYKEDNFLLVSSIIFFLSFTEQDNLLKNILEYSLTQTDIWVLRGIISQKFCGYARKLFLKVLLKILGSMPF